MVVLFPAGVNTMPAIARLVPADEDTIRQVIRRFNRTPGGVLQCHRDEGTKVCLIVRKANKCLFR